MYRLSTFTHVRIRILNQPWRTQRLQSTTNNNVCNQQQITFLRVILTEGRIRKVVPKACLRARES